jgi:hypothetical protein
MIRGMRLNVFPFTRIFLRTLKDPYRETEFFSIYEDLPKDFGGSAP